MVSLPSRVREVKLQVGELAETVTVTSSAPLLETEKGDRGAVVDKMRITDLPLNVTDKFGDFYPPVDG